MIRIRVIVAAWLALGIASASIALASSAEASQGLATTFTTDSSSGDGYRATFTITNGTSTVVGSWSVAVILPAGARVSDPFGANIVVNGQLVTASNTANQGRLAPGAKATLGFVVHGGAAPPSACVTNGVPCQPVAPPSGTPSPGPPASAPGTPATQTTTPTTTPTPTPAPSAKPSSTSESSTPPAPQPTTTAPSSPSASPSA